MPSVKDGLYNKATGFPSEDVYSAFVGLWKPNYTLHALKASRTEEFGTVLLPREIYVHLKHVVEIEVKNGKCEVVVVRQSYSQSLDRVMVLSHPDPSRAITVVTVWLNRVEGHHAPANNRPRLVKNVHA